MIFPCPRACLRIWSREMGSAVPSRVSLLISILRLNLVLTYGITPEFRGGVHMKPPYAIGSVPSLSGHAIAYRWRSLPRVRRHRASKPQGSSERVLPWQITMDQLIFASLSHTCMCVFFHINRTIRASAMCVCVFFPSILEIKFVGRTSRGHTGGRSHRIFNPPSFCGACLDFCREKDSAIPFPRRP